MGFNWGDLNPFKNPFNSDNHVPVLGDAGDWAQNQWNALSGKQGYDTLAAGAQDVSNRGAAFSQEQWDRQMQGLAQAQGAYAPAQNQWNATYGSNQGPGAAENFYAQNGNKFQNTPYQQDTYNAFSQWANNPANNATANGATQANQYLRGSTATSDAYGSLAPQLQYYSGPNSGAQQYQASYGGYNSPGAAEQWNKQNQGAYSQPLNSQNVFNQLGMQLSSPGQSQMFKLDAQNPVGDALGSFTSFGRGQTDGQANSGENKGYIRGATQANDWYQSQAPQLSAPGQYEQFVSSDINGSNPQLRMARDEATASLNQELARRGHFDSGGADVALGKLGGTFEAQDYQNRAQRAQQAQQMQLSRIGQGGQLAQSAANTGIAQGTALQGIDSSNEAAALARRQLELQADTQAGVAHAQNQSLALQAAGQADNQQLARLQGLSSMANSSDQMRLQQLQQGQQAAGMAQQQQLARLQGAQGAASGVDQTRLASDQQQLARLGQSYNMAQGSDASNLARAQQMFLEGQGVDASQMNRYKMQGDMSQGLDQFNLQSLLGQGQMAGQAQTDEQARKAALFSSLFGLNNAQAGQVGQFYGQGGQMSGQAMSDSLNALMQMYGNKAEGQNASGDMIGKIFGQLFNNVGAGAKLAGGA